MKQKHNKRGLCLWAALILTASIPTSNAQSWICGTDGPDTTASANLSQNCIGSSAAFTSKYGLQSFYVPTMNDPVITVKLTFHIMNKNDGTGSFQSTGQDFADIQNIANLFLDGYERYSEPRNAAYTVSGFVSPHTVNKPNSATLQDSRVRYIVTNVYFYNNTSLFTGGISSLISNLATNYPARLSEGIPIFFGSGFVPNGGAGYAPVTNGQSAILTNMKPANGVWFTYEHLRHEMGHLMDWWHTYGTELSPVNAGGRPCGTPDFLSDVFPQNNPMCPTGTHPCNTCDETPALTVGWSNNVMGAHAPNDWMSPLQMGRRIRGLHLKFQDIRNYVQEQKSEYQYPWLITSNETWDFDIQMYRDIVVKAGNTLSITCRVAMPTDGKIIVEKGARLVIDGGEVTSWCKKTPVTGCNFNMPLWTGVEVAGDPSQNQLINNSTGYCANQGIVEVKNGGTISYAYKGINTSLTSAFGVWQPNTSGGIVIASNSSFINNVYDIIFYRYQNGNAKSKLTNCTFKTSAEIGRFGNNAQIVPKEHVKIFDNSGVNIYGCTFEYAAGSTYAASDRGIGLLATDGNFNLDWNCPANNCVSSSVRTKFINLTAGAWIDNSNSLFTGTVKHCDFVNSTVRGAMVENSYNLIFSDNTISMNGNQEGIYLYKSKYYVVKNNTISGQYWQGGGVIAYDSKEGLHQVYRNTFTGLNTGVLAMDNNGGLSSNGFGLKMNCNVFNSGATNMFDIGLTPSLAAMPIVMKAQSPFNAQNGPQLVRNLYGASYMSSSTQNKWYVDATSTQSIWHASTPTGVDNPNVPNTQASSQIQVLPANVTFIYSSDCPAVLPSNGGSASTSSQRLANLNTYITDARSNSDYAEVQASVANKLNLFATDSLPEGQDSVIAVLQHNQGGMDDADVLEVFAHIWKADYAAATDKANELSNNRADWKDLLLKIIELKQDSMDYFSLLTNTDNVEFLQGYANTEGRDGQANAQAILRLVFDTDHDYPVVYPPMPDSEGRPLGIVEVSNANFSLYPNPTRSGVTIVNTAGKEETMKIEVRDLLGRVVFTTFSKDDKTYVPMSACGNGVYIVTASKSNEVIYRSKIMKQD